MIDFEQTYKHRRAVYRAIQQSQKSESEIAEKVSKIAVNGKRELLVFLSTWLLDMSSTGSISATERTEIQRFTQISFDSWMQLQAVAAQIEKDLAEVKDKEKEAVATLQTSAPYGAATKLFAGSESKTQIQILQKKVSVIQKHHESLADALKQNTAKRQLLGEGFFRDCLTQLDKLAKSQALGKEVSMIITRMTTEMNATWAGHQKEQNEELTQMAGLVEMLRNSYQDVSAALTDQETIFTTPKQVQGLNK